MAGIIDAQGQWEQCNACGNFVLAFPRNPRWRTKLYLGVPTVAAIATAKRLTAEWAAAGPDRSGNVDWLDSSDRPTALVSLCYDCAAKGSMLQDVPGVWEKMRKTFGIGG
jgi:hypothetical protein